MNGEELKSWLEEQRITRTDLAKILGVSRALVSAWTLGTRDVPLWLPYAIGLVSLNKTLRLKPRK